MRQIIGKKIYWKVYGTWVTPKAEVMWEVTGTQSTMTYMGIIQGTVAQYVALRPIFEVCARETGDDVGGHRRGSWWR